MSTRVMETDKGEPDRGKGGGCDPLCVAARAVIVITTTLCPDNSNVPREQNQDETARVEAKKAKQTLASQNLLTEKTGGIIFEEE